MPESHPSPARSNSGSGFSSWFARFSKPDLIFFSVLTILLLCGIWYLTEAENPWGKAIQRRLSKGQAFQLSEFVIIGLWWGTLIASICLVFSLITYRWWRPDGTVPSQVIPATPAHKGNKLFVALTILAVATAIWEAYPRLSHSLWNDEEYAMRRYAHGAWEAQQDGSWKFEPVKWTDTLFLNRQGNNHLINSLSMNLTLKTWRALTGTPVEQFDEFVLRLPAFFLSIGTVIFTALLGRMMGYSLVGGVAALLLALNPWFIHYMSDAKGYSSLMCFMSLHYIGLIKALQTDKLRWWLLFTFAQCFYVLSFSGSIYIAISTNLLASIELIRQRRAKKILTLAGFCLVSALPVIVWVAPSVPQYLYYLNKEDALRLPMDWTWIRDLLCALYVGVSHENILPEHHIGTSWTMLKNAVPGFIYTGYSLFFIPLLALIGLVATFLRGTSSRIILLSPLLAAVLSFYHNSGSDHPMVIWYLIFLVVPLSLLLALGARTLGARSYPAAIVLSLILVSGYATVTAESNRLQRLYDRQPIREMADWIKQQEPNPAITEAEKQNPHHPAHTNAITATWGVSQNQSRSYLPKTQFPESISDLEKLEAQSTAEKRPLYIYVCGNDATSKRNPDLMGHVRNSGRYQEVQEVKGLEELFTYVIFKFIPPAADPAPAKVPAPNPAPPPASPQVETPREVVPVTPDPSIIPPAPEATREQAPTAP